MWPVPVDKERLSGQVDDLPSPSYGKGPPAGTLWPGGEISLVELIKLCILPTDQESLRIKAPGNVHPHKAVGKRQRVLT